MDHANPTEGLSRAHYLAVFLLLLALWILLTASLQPAELALGTLVSLVVTIVSRPRLQLFSGVRLTPLAPVYLFRYLGYLLVALIRSNLDMARRVLSPRLPLDPAVVEVHTDLRSAIGRLALANSITLTPGTLSVDVHDDRILVHWIDCPADDDLESATRQIAAGFERHLKGFLQ